MASFGTAISSNARKLSQRNRRRIGMLSREVRDAMYASQTRVLVTAAQWSSGPFKTKWLKRQAAKRKPPRGLYSVVAPLPPTDPAMINQQTGTFKAGWKSRRYATTTSIGMTIYNDAPKARYMWGIRRYASSPMIYRPILDKVVELERPRFLLKIVDAGHTALRLQ